MRFPDCVMCRGAEGDPELHRVQVWENELWRLTTSLAAEVEGFSYLEPKRHVPTIDRLDGEEAATFGDAVARATSALKRATGAGLVFVYVFGDSVPHLHVNLAPHHDGDGLSTQMIKGTIVERELPSGAILQTSDTYPPLPEERLRDAADRIRRELAG
jgi:diadenosine tetraphosphate (Ap4A) HIT family hydrolase